MFSQTLDALLRAFSELAIPEKDHFSTVIVAQAPQVAYLVKTDKGRAAFLIERSFAQIKAAREVGKIKIESIEWNASGSIAEPRRPALLVTLMVQDDAALKGFLIAALGFVPEIQKVDDTTALQHLENLALTMNLSRTPQTTVRGLWAELFVMNLFPEPSAGAQAWQQSSVERFDFAFGNTRLEVKSFHGQERELEFRHQQMHVEDSLNLLVASLKVVESPAGKSLRDLADAIWTNLSDPSLKSRLMKVVQEICDVRAEEAETNFDIATAEATVAISRGSVLPRFPAVLPAGIIDARIKVRLETSHLSSLGAEQVRREISQHLEP